VSGAGTRCVQGLSEPAGAAGFRGLAGLASPCCASESRARALLLPPLSPPYPHNKGDGDHPRRHLRLRSNRSVYVAVSHLFRFPRPSVVSFVCWRRLMFAPHCLSCSLSPSFAPPLRPEWIKRGSFVLFALRRSRSFGGRLEGSGEGRWRELGRRVKLGLSCAPLRRGSYIQSAPFVPPTKRSGLNELGWGWPGPVSDWFP
jgi:hypothetical protein